MSRNVSLILTLAVVVGTISNGRVEALGKRTNKGSAAAFRQGTTLSRNGAEIRTEMKQLMRAGLVSASKTAESAEPSLCPMSSDLDRPEPVDDLVRCPEYSASSCCSKAEDTALDEQFKAAYEYVYSGCDGCLENFRLLACSVHCSPSQVDFVTVTPADDLNDETKTIRICPQFCERFYGSCVNTTAREISHADDGAFCVSQEVVPSSASETVVLTLDQYSCINAAGPTYCNGEYVHEVEDDDSLTSQQLVKLSLIAACVAVVLCAGSYMLCCKSERADGTVKETTNDPYLQQKLIVNAADDEKDK